MPHVTLSSRLSSRPPSVQFTCPVHRPAIPGGARGKRPCQPSEVETEVWSGRKKGLKQGAKMGGGGEGEKEFTAVEGGGAQAGGRRTCYPRSIAS